MRRTAHTAADGVGATEWLEMGGEKKPLEISELGCADGCGREMGAAADGVGEGVAGNGWGEEAAGDERAWLRGRLRTAWEGMAGNGWGEEAAGDQRAWLRGRPRTGNGCGQLRGRLRTAWVQGSGWKWVGRRSRWRSASLAARTAADGKWVRRIARTAADGVGAREWLEMGGEKKPLVMMAARTAADGKWARTIARTAADGAGARRSRW